MTISSSTNRSPIYTSTGTGPFAFSFKTFDDDDLVVTKVSPAGVESTLTLSADYSAVLNADQNNNPGGEVTLSVALVSGESLLIRRVVPLTQGLDLVTAGGFYPEAIEDALDRMTMLAQQVAEETDRALSLPPASEASSELPPPEAGKYLGWSDDGLSLVNRAYVDAGALALPVSLANGGTGVGTLAALQSLLGVATPRVSTRASNTILGAGDFGSTIVATAVFTQTLTAAATLGAGWWCEYVNRSGGLAVLDPNGAETINGQSAVRLVNGQSCKVICDGAAFYTVGGGVGYGECVLTKPSANIRLDPFNGQRLMVGGNVCIVPAAGVSLSAAALAPSTTYYVYATAAGGLVNALEASVTAPIADAGSGVMVKNGDATRTLVGMARTTSGTAWADTNKQRFVRSWFNDKPVAVYDKMLGAAFAPAVAGEVDAGFVAEWVQWVGDAFVGQLVVFAKDAASALASTAYVYIDGIAQSASYISNAINYTVSSSVAFATSDLAEGYHIAQAYGTGVSGTVEWSGNTRMAFTITP